MAAIKVLLVDDDEVILALLSDFLSKEGFEITTASNAREALKLITSHTYDVLLSDLNMPGPGDGFTVLGASRHLSPETVTILLSALPRMGTAAQAILRHADEILLKPVDPALLAAAIRRKVARERGGAQQDGKQRVVPNTPENDDMLTVAHELRTPLTSIRGALGLLVDGRVGTVDERGQRLLAIALTNADRMIRLLNRQLDLGRLDAGFATLQIRRCSFGVLVRQAIEEMATTAELAQVRISVPTFAILGDPEIFLDADPDMILQVLTNLLANAIKFSSPGSEVAIDLEAPPTALIFRVVDQGRGIPEAQLETIFERFHQVEAATADRQLGTGLGLAICRAIVQQHGGTITAARNFAQGSTFEVNIPRTQRALDGISTS